MTQYDHPCEAEFGGLTEDIPDQQATDALPLRIWPDRNGPQGEQPWLWEMTLETNSGQQHVPDQSTVLFRDPRELGDPGLRSPQGVDQARLAVPAEGSSMHFRNRLEICALFDTNFAFHVYEAIEAALGS